MTDEQRVKVKLVLRTLDEINLEGMRTDAVEAVMKMYEYLRDLLSECPTCSGTGKIDVVI